jgi:ubiquinone/menaquinone biosynthesis C-methylase UbiE/uncharacterized protein YbaR (Trm112 family)
MEISIEPLLRCPITHSPLTRLSADQVNDLNQKIATGELFHLDGTLVKSAMETTLLSENGAFAYPIVEGIYILMSNLAIVLDNELAKLYQTSLVQEKIDMVVFYDQLGWQQGDNQRFVDAARFEDFRPVTWDYIHRCHLRLARYFAPSGDFLLDIASGPVQYSEYEAYSNQYKHRICADISFVALQAARKKLGDHGIYLLCDITNIPLLENVVDAFLSLHTVYHVPAAEQKSAFAELQRVLKSGRTGVVVYSWGKKALLMRIVSPWLKFVKGCRRFLVEFRKRVRGISFLDQEKKITCITKIEKPYFHAHTYKWMREEVFPLGYTDMACWRSVSVPFLRYLVHPHLFGKQFLMVLYWLEGRYKHFFARYGQYPILICQK